MKGLWWGNGKGGDLNKEVTNKIGLYSMHKMSMTMKMRQAILVQFTCVHVKCMKYNKVKNAFVSI